MKNNKIYLCAICNIESGTCNEDCKFCTQSVKYKANIQRYKRKDIQDILKEAKIAKNNKAIGYCLVTAGGGLTDEKVEFICSTARELKKNIPDLNLIACNGLATKEQLKELKKSGIDNYNHNLETSKEFYQEICTTHNWEDRYQTCLNIKEVGLNLITGGIFGMGETQKDRISMLNSIKELNPKTTPLNFFHPNEALPIVENSLTMQDAFKLIKLSREILGEELRLMVAGGRENTFKEKQYDIFKYGANSIVIGNYLTTSGKLASKDIVAIENLGLEIVSSCK
ncbi:MAG: biotin synthase [Campylobacterota bacterium]|nr:biotin synthase [Campylobacterota bacterium]